MSSLRGLLASECDIQQLQVELPSFHVGTMGASLRGKYAIVIDTWSSGPLQHVPERPFLGCLTKSYV